MENKNKAIIIIIFLLLVGLIIYININLQVSGSDIEYVDEITSYNLVSLTKWNLQNDERVEYILNKKQKVKLQNLIVGSSYRKLLSSKVSSSESVRYEIMVKKSEKEVHLIIYSMGADYITIPHQFDGRFLKIKNPDWKENIEEIILLSN